MKKILNILLKFLSFVLFSVIGIAIGIMVAFGFIAGYFSGWKSLAGSYEFERIEEANSKIVVARATDGKLYSWDSNCDRDKHCKTWMEVDRIPDNMHFGGEYAMEKNDTCGSWLEPPIWKPRNVIECARGWYGGPEFGSTTLYALLKNGEILASHHFSTSITDPIIFAFLGFIGFVLGMTAFGYFMKLLTDKEVPIPPSNITV